MSITVCPAIVSVASVLAANASPELNERFAREATAVGITVGVFALFGLFILFMCLHRNARVVLATAGGGVCVLIGGWCLLAAISGDGKPMSVDEGGLVAFFALWLGFLGGSAFLLLACLIAFLVGLIRLSASAKARGDAPPACPRCECRLDGPDPTRCPNCGMRVSVARHQGTHRS